MVLIPLGLAVPTAWLVVPVHLVFAALVTVATLGEGLSGHPERARRWGLGYIVSSLLLVAAMELGAALRGTAYWQLPLALMLLWGWVPPAVAMVAGGVGELRERALGRRAVRRRKVARVEQRRR